MNKTISFKNPLRLEGNWLIGLKFLRLPSIFKAMEESYKFIYSSANLKMLKAIRYFKTQSYELVLGEEIDEKFRPTIMKKFKEILYNLLF